MNDTATIEKPATESDGWEWCLVEIMGHRSHWGRSREEERFGAKMIRIDVPIEGDPAKGWITHYYGGASIFSYSLTDEATVMRRNKPWEPPSRIALAGRAPTQADADHLKTGMLAALSPPQQPTPSQRIEPSEPEEGGKDEGASSGGAVAVREALKPFAALGAPRGETADTARVDIWERDNHGDTRVLLTSPSQQGGSVTLSTADFRAAHTAFSSAPALAVLPDCGAGEPVAWRCFHCGEVFTDPKAAANHFGVDHIGDEALCQMAQVDGGIARVIADLSEELQRYRMEDNTSYREFYALGADHSQALRCEEEKGYARGLIDGQALAASQPAPRLEREALIEECAKIADRASLRCVRKQIPGDGAANFIAQEIRALLAPAGGR